MRRLIALLACATLLASCGRDDSPPPTPNPSSSSGSSAKTPEGSGAATSSTQNGGSSPQDVFDKVKVAATKKDWNALWSCICPDEADEVLFAFTLMAAFSTMGDEAKAKEFEALGKKHGVKERAKDAPPMKLDDPEARKKAMEEMFSGVSDKKAYFLELMTFADRDTKAGEGLQLDEKATLKDVKEEGDKATATLVKGDGKGDSTMVFKKRDGRWYMSLDR
jgi:hypothetical protein